MNVDQEPPVLRGDGVTDDTVAYQWYIDHGATIPADREYLVDVAKLRLPEGYWLFSRAPTFPKDRKLQGTDR